LDRLPAAEVLRSVLEDAWASSVLPKRTKAMVFAVVARGLGCERGEEEAARLLGDEGLGGDVVGEVLSRLASPKLDDLESAIVPFARETLWYRPAQIQRRGRELRSLLSNEQFIELVGIAALANAVCRMSVIVDSPSL
jgi:alkylhydroperoxidase family enzyme